jgi:hypothetical protein
VLGARQCIRFSDRFGIRYCPVMFLDSATRPETRATSILEAMPGRISQKAAVLAKRKQAEKLTRLRGSLGGTVRSLYGCYLPGSACSCLIGASSGGRLVTRWVQAPRSLARGCIGGPAPVQTRPWRWRSHGPRNARPQNSALCRTRQSSDLVCSKLLTVSGVARARTSRAF